jgi:hypothetical protein
MRNVWPLVVAAAFGVVAAAVPASAQTVIARNVPVGTTVELVLNDTKAGTATPDAIGDAKIPFKIQSASGKEMDVTVRVDICDSVRRVIVVERGRSAAPPEAGCSRRDVQGLYLVKSVTNLVVDTEPPNPTVWLRQGSVDLRPKSQGGSTWGDMPTGLIVFGGAGIGKYRDQPSFLCGNVTNCSSSGTLFTFALGGTFWLSRMIGVEGAYVQPFDVNANGSGSNFHFTSTLEAHLFAINGKFGIPAGRARIYGQGGMNYHSASLKTTQTNDDIPIVVSGASATLPGGIQVIELKTGGWGWQFGGGVEIWLSRKIGIYGEAGLSRLKGDSVEGPQAEMDDYLTTVLGGMRFKIGK